VASAEPRTRLLPGPVLERLEAYRQRRASGVTPAMLALWEQWTGMALEALRAGARAPRQRFQPPEELLQLRRRIAERHLRGQGIEIGALHNPLPLPAGARARYVDLDEIEVVSLLHPELARYELTPADVIDDGETLSRFEDESLDFVVSCHVLEHCQDPLGALRHQARVLRPGGVLYCVVPDCRRTFDSGRARTTFEHLWRDHESGPAGSREEHYRDWSLHVNGRSGTEHEAWWRLLDALDYRIHFHVWTPDDVRFLFAELQRRVGLPLGLQEFSEHSDECLLVAYRQ